MGQLKQWRNEKWVRITTSGKIAGECGTSKEKDNPDRCLPLAKAREMTRRERAATARKKRSKGKNKQFVKNTKKSRVLRRKKVKSGGKICAKGKRKAMIKYRKWSAYAAMYASKVCKGS